VLPFPMHAFRDNKTGTVVLTRTAGLANATFLLAYQRSRILYGIVVYVNQMCLTFYDVVIMKFIIFEFFFSHDNGRRKESHAIIIHTTTAIVSDVH
jgi:hypothetical protein